MQFPSVNAVKFDGTVSAFLGQQNRAIHLHDPKYFTRNGILLVPLLKKEPSLFKEAQEHAQLLETWRVEKVKRGCNNFVAHELAQLARRNRHTAMWLRQGACVHAFLTSSKTIIILRSV